MPIPVEQAVADSAAAAEAKSREATSNLPRYLMSSGLAGAYVGIAVVLLLAVGSAFVAAQSPAAKLVQGSVFGIALTLVVFAGAELFTGNVMVMLHGLMAKRVKGTDLALVWAASLLGNLVGALAFAALVNASGVLSFGAPAGTQTIFMAALAGVIKTKAALSGGQLFFRAVLCNMLVCLAIWMSTRAKSDGAKLLCLWWALLAFIGSGFEHSIANMTIFGLALFGHVPLATFSEFVRNLIYTVSGNIVGGGVLVGAAYGWFARPEPVEAITVQAADAVENGNGATPPARKRTTTAPPRRVPSSAR